MFHSAGGGGGLVGDDVICFISTWRCRSDVTGRKLHPVVLLMKSFWIKI